MWSLEAFNHFNLVIHYICLPPPPPPPPSSIPLPPPFLSAVAETSSLVPRPPPRFYLTAVEIKSGRRPGNEAGKHPCPWALCIYIISRPSQLAVVPEHNIFLGLSDGEVFYADLESFMILGHLSRSRGASYFAVDWQKLRAHGVGYGRGLRICIATRKKLIVYEYRRSVFVAAKVSTSGGFGLWGQGGGDCAKWALPPALHAKPVLNIY